jgi:hypothetical protein
LGKKGHGCGCGGLLGRGIAGWDAGYNCGCNGSYNYPVPPLYTYHWPGMYKQQLMTEYDSPWRFPPLKPYEDEQVEGEVDGSEMARQPEAGVLPISYEQSTRSSWRERSVSELLQNMSR